MPTQRRFAHEALFWLVAVFVTAAGLLGLLSPAAQARPKMAPPLAVAYPVPTEAPAPDPFEPNDACTQAGSILVDVIQNHNFHDETETDWLRFDAQANTTYIVEVRKIGADANPVIAIQDTCDDPPFTFASSPYGTIVELQWNATRNGAYYLKLQGNDPVVHGAETAYGVLIRKDNVPPSIPEEPRCFAINATTVGVQWQRSREPDVTGYEVRYSRVDGAEGGIVPTTGAKTTIAEVTPLTQGEEYRFFVYALDFSRNKSPEAGPVTCLAEEPPDRTAPTVALQNPQITAVHTTTSNLLTFTGLAEDAGRNLSRVNVTNVTRGDNDWDYSLSGEEATFRVEDMRLQVGANVIKVTAYDEVGNSSEQTIQVNRLGTVQGAAVIVAGHNETFALQLNIYNAANRAFRIFKAAGYDPDDIYYISPVPQDADGDGASDVDATTSLAAIQAAFDSWARQGSRTGPGKPFFVYFIDHGLDEKFCATGCDTAQSVTPVQVNSWLDALQTATGADQVTFIIEACRSGTFIDKENGNPLGGLGRTGRVIISSTGAKNNAYASAEGAYFSDAFFSCAVNSNNLKACFDEAVAAVKAIGVNQTPWLDDNGDGIFNDGDGALATQRFLTSLFTSQTPTIEAARVVRDGDSATLEATVAEGVEETALVWASVYPPFFVEPVDVTPNLFVPVVRLDPVVGQTGKYRFIYTAGVPASGSYRIVLYAQDRLGIHAGPLTRFAEGEVHMPSIRK